MIHPLTRMGTFGILHHLPEAFQTRVSLSMKDKWRSVPGKDRELHLSRFHVGDALLEAGGVYFISLAFGDRYICRGQRFFFPTRGPKQIGLRRQVSKGLFDFDRLIDPL